MSSLPDTNAHPRPHSHPRPDLGGLWIPLVTPFRAGEVDHAAAVRLARHVLHEGAHGLVLCGSTGEAAALSNGEQLALLDALCASLPNARIVMGVAGNHLPSTLAHVQLLSSRPVTGLLVSAPGYIRPSQEGVHAWFTAIADASSVPVLLYDIPYRTGVTLARETLLALARHPRIVGIKDCGGDLAKTLALVADGRLQVLAGEDVQLFTHIAAGAVGSITASAHLHTARFAQVVHALRAGDVATARALFLPLVPLVEALFAEPNPAPVKAALAADGWIDSGLRVPMTAASPQLQARLSATRAALKEGG